MRQFADSRGRLAAREFFSPGTAFDVSRQPDGSIRVIELVEKQVPMVKLCNSKDGLFTCPSFMNRDEVKAAIRADREMQ